MIRMTRLSGEEIFVNARQIECIVKIPETKVILLTGKYYIVKEEPEEIVRRAVHFEGKILADARREIERGLAGEPEQVPEEEG